MISDLIRNIFRFFFLCLAQVLIFQDLELGRFINLFPYVLFILLLPFITPSWLVLLLSFFTGLVIDFYYNTGGIQASACVLMAFVRTGFLKLFSQREGFEPGMEPTRQFLGTSGFFSYAGVLIFIHHFVAFYLEAFRLSELFITFLRVVLSSAGTLLVVVLIQFLFYKKKQRT